MQQASSSHGLQADGNGRTAERLQPCRTGYGQEMMFEVLVQLADRVVNCTQNPMAAHYRWKPINDLLLWPSIATTTALKKRRHMGKLTGDI